MAIAGFAFAADDADQSSPYLIASSRVSPEYPPAAQAARWEGTVILAAQVFADGTVGEIEVVDSTHPSLGFEESAMKAMKQWRFEPARSDGKAVEAVSMFRLAFRIPGTSTRNFPFVAGEQVASKLAQPGMAVSVASFSDEAYRMAGTPAQDRIMKMGRPPVMMEGAMYDRRDLFPVPASGNYMPNR
jgi:protein TonB